MLSKNNRIARSEVEAILKSRKFFQSPHLTLRVGESGNSKKFAISVSKKVSKSAVERNKIRRRVYSAIRRHLPTILPSLYFFSAKRDAGKIKMENLEQEITSLLKVAQKS